MAPEYLSCLLSRKEEAAYQLRSNSSHILVVPRFFTKFGERSFAVAGPRLWNPLPLEIKECSSLTNFKCKLKTYFFKQAFNV
ncbi:hypothetical protein HOLleu_08765 [Holothuria leucospilota]|uniref:Uncharacterized protein n=1 Tax=Holothuria leucospilota TaxID=206669 RepID=A0A9Q1CHX0_HOLLE|nr:hypothetical protein HOLleu_08765 [Holothuria leucospilota]